MRVQEAYRAQWRSFNDKVDIMVVFTITDAIGYAKHIGDRYHGALTLITGSLRLVGGALSILESETSD